MSTWPYGWQTTYLTSSTECPWLYESGYLCGLRPGHDGEHVPFIPGEYLRIPLVHPLDLWLAGSRGHCPACGRRVHAWEFDGPTEYLIDTGGQYEHHDVFAPYRMEPCGCEFRETLDMSAEEVRATRYSVYIWQGRPA